MAAGRLPRVIFALVVVALAVAWIGRSLFVPIAPLHSAEALLRGHAPAAPRAPLEKPDPATVDRARVLVETEPLAAEAYAVLALAAAQGGHDDTAAQLMQVSANWWPRDFLVQSWLLARSLRLGDRQAIVSRFDVIARVRPDMLDDMTAAVAPILVDPGASAAFAGLLATRPPWRWRFIDIAVRQWRDPAGLIGLLGRLQTPPSSLETAELRPYLAKLLVTQHVDQAYAAWLRSLPPERLAKLGYLYNGHFQHPVSDLPFDWQMPASPRTRAAVSGPAKARVLTIGFLGGRIAVQPLQHDLALAPGAYRLSGRVATDRLRTEEGIRWRVACLNDPDHVLASSELFKGTAGWRDFAMDFTLPETGCGAQVLGLEVYPPTAQGQEASGIASFAGLDVQPHSASDRAP